MKEKIRKKTKRPQTEDMIFTEEDFEDVSEETKGNSPKHRKRSRRTSGGFPVRKAGIIAGGVVGVLVLLYLGISVFFMSHFYINTTINGKDFSGRSASSVEGVHFHPEQRGKKELIIFSSNTPCPPAVFHTL